MTLKKTVTLISVVIILSISAFFMACSEDDETFDCPEVTLSNNICNSGTFTVDIDNEFLPYNVGDVMVLEGNDEGTIIRVVISVLDETEEVAGVTTRVVMEEEYENGEVIEISKNFFAQAEDGTVCYFGEDVDIYENGVVVSHDGEWRAGDNGYLAGIIMPGTPSVGQAFYQEQASGVAEDMSAIKQFGESISVPAGSFSDTVTTNDYNPIDDEDPCEPERKVYVKGIGLAIDEVMELTSY